MCMLFMVVDRGVDQVQQCNGQQLSSHHPRLDGLGPAGPAAAKACARHNIFSVVDYIPTPLSDNHELLAVFCQMP